VSFNLPKEENKKNEQNQHSQTLKKVEIVQLLNKTKQKQQKREYSNQRIIYFSICLNIIKLCVFVTNH
jgi:hypothetical protein